MFEAIQGWIQANPLTSAIAMCYLLTFVAVRQIKPFLPHFPITSLPPMVGDRLILRLSVFVCGCLISLVVAGGLRVFEICPISPVQILYVAGSVGFLAPFIYDLLLGTISLLEFVKVLPKGISKKIKWLIDPQKVETVVNNSGEIEKVRVDDKTVWRRSQP